jgi:hypothetical protein
MATAVWWRCTAVLLEQELPGSRPIKVPRAQTAASHDPRRIEDALLTKSA